MASLGGMASMNAMAAASLRQQQQAQAMFGADLTDPHDASGGRARKQRFLFTEDQDILLVREAIKDFPFGAVHGDRLKMWNNMAVRLQQLDQRMNVDGRRCRERCDLLVQSYRTGKTVVTKNTGAPSKDAELKRFLAVLTQMLDNAERVREERRDKKRRRAGEDDLGEGDVSPSRRRADGGDGSRDDGSDGDDMRAPDLDPIELTRGGRRSISERLDILQTKMDQLSRLMREDAERRERMMAQEREKLEVERRRLESASEVRRRLTEAVVAAIAALTQNSQGV